MVEVVGIHKGGDLTFEKTMSVCVCMPKHAIPRIKTPL